MRCNKFTYRFNQLIYLYIAVAELRICLHCNKFIFRFNQLIYFIYRCWPSTCHRRRNPLRRCPSRRRQPIVIVAIVGRRHHRRHRPSPVAIIVNSSSLWKPFAPLPIMSSPAPLSLSLSRRPSRRRYRRHHCCCNKFIFRYNKLINFIYH